MHSQDWWTNLLTQLRDDVDGVVDEFVSRVRVIPPYRRGAVPVDRLVTDARLTFEYLLRRIAGQPIPELLADIGPSIGRDRARRGVPLNDLLTAVRMDFRVLWSALREQVEPRLEPLLVEHVEDVWNAVEEYTNQIQLSYQVEAALLASERQGERTMLVAELLNSQNPDADDVLRVATALGIDTRAELLVAAAAASNGRMLRRAADRLSAGGRVVHVQSSGRYSVLIARWDGGEGAPVRAALAGVPCGVGPLAHGLAQVPRSARLAREIVDALPDAEGPKELADAWLPLAGSRLADTAAELVDSVLGGLAGAPAVEHARLLETVRCYAECGSVGEVATSLYCHRNTVLNRLRRFTELTGRDVTVPAESATILLALSCLRAP